MRDANKPTAARDTSVAQDEPVETTASAQAVTPDDAAPVELLDDLTLADTPAEPASVHVIVMGDRTRIVVSGEIDADLAADLQEATADAESTGLPIEVDAQHVTFMDSSGVAFLARLAARSADRVRVLHAPETVRFLLEVTRIGELLDLVDDPATEPADAPAPRPTPPDVVA